MKRSLWMAMGWFWCIAALGYDTSDLTEEQQQQFNELATDLRCPTCVGLSVNESDAGFSVQIKDAVKEQIKQGKASDEIMEFFTDRYGLWILREPPSEGKHLGAWIVPIAVMIIGPFLIWLLVWRRRKVLEVLGVRPTSTLLAEMEHKLQTMRQKGNPS